MPKAYAAYSKDEAMRKQSSSGGIFTEVAKTILENGGVIFGAAYNEQFEVVHICADSEGELAKLRGAKYAQSDLRGIFADVKTILDKGQQVLFSGTPCQVGGLKSYLCKDYENLVTVDFVCHSVPSPMAWREYVKYRAAQDNGGKLPYSIDLRSKTTGWSHHQYSNLFRYADDSIHTVKSGDSLYMKLFVGGCISRRSCENCLFKGYSRASDLTLGDFWGIWDIAPEVDDSKGTSLVLVQSPRGADLLEKISNKLVLRKVALDETSQQNQALIRASQASASRDEFLQLVRNSNFPGVQILIEKKKHQKPNILWRLMRKVSHFIG